MRSILATWLSLTPLLLQGRALPQEEGAKPPATVLTAKEHEELGKTLGNWFELRIKEVALENEGEKASAAKLKQAREKSRDAKKKFWEELEKKSAKAGGTLLKQVPDLKAIFAYAFRYKNQSVTGDVNARTEKLGDDKQVTYALSAPKTYRTDQAYPLLISLPPRAEDGKKWGESKKHLETLWKGNPILAEWVVVAPNFPDDLLLDKSVDLTKNTDMATEDERIQYFWNPVKPLLDDFHLDTNKMVLECTGQSCLFGMRIATYFPDRFAGLVLREPGDLASIRPENLKYVPVCVVASGAAEKSVDALLKRLEDAGIKTKKIVAKGHVPFVEESGDVFTWMKNLERNVFPADVTIAPTHNRYSKRAYWAGIDVCDSELSRLDISCDRAQNRINVTSKGVQKFQVFLNDALVDMDKKITIFANGSHLWSGTWERDREYLTGEVLRRNDVNFLFVKMAAFDIPRAPASKPADGAPEKTEESPDAKIGEGKKKD